MAENVLTAHPLLAQAAEVADAIHEQDQAVEELRLSASAPNETIYLYPTSCPRAEDTRLPWQKEFGRVNCLGLIEPLVVDLKGNVAGRCFIIGSYQFLKENESRTLLGCALTASLPVRIMSFDAEAEPGVHSR